MKSFGNLSRKAAGIGSLPLEPTAALRAYLANPSGRFVAADNVAIFALGAPPMTVEGLSLWGRPSNADVEVIALTVGRGSGAPARSGAWLVDLRRLDCIDLRVFSKLSSVLAPWCRLARLRADRHAVLRPDGPAGILAAELVIALSHGCGARSFVDAREALGWMGVDQPALLDDLERLGATGPAHPPLAGALRELLEQSPAITVAQAARRLGVSQRTLQRRLRETGTSFQREVDLGRLEIAKRLMRATRQPLKCIALEAGYVSPQHFSSAFHRHIGMSPRRWRAAQSE